MRLFFAERSSDGVRGSSANSSRHLGIHLRPETPHLLLAPVGMVEQGDDPVPFRRHGFVLQGQRSHVDRVEDAIYRVLGGNARQYLGVSRAITITAARTLAGWNGCQHS